MSAFLTDRLAPGEHLLLFEALEASADQIGLGITISRIDVVPPELLYVSQSMAALLHQPLAEGAFTSPLEYMVESDRPRVQALIASRHGDAPPLLIEVEMLRPDGSRVPVEVGVARVASSLGLLAICHIRDVSVRHEALAALQRSEHRFRMLIEQAPDGVVILRGGTIVFANATAAHLLRLLDPSAAIGLHIDQLLPPGDAARAGERFGELLRSGIDFPPSEYGLLADPTRRVEIKSLACDWEGAPAVIAFARDVTERAALQREMLRADRLASMGTLAAAVAHEVNNPLTYATLSLRQLEQQLLRPDGPPGLLEHVRNAREGLDRVATIVRDLTTYARDSETASGAIDLADVLERALKMVDHDLRHRARLVRRYGDVPPVDGNASRLEQVFVNLLVNAAQALRGPAAEQQISVETGLTPDGLVYAAVRDTGTGIAAAVRDRIFDPFFTTKAVGEGTGLGLPVSKSIVEAMGGRIELQSVEGMGTSVTIVLRPQRRLLTAPGVPVIASVSAPSARRLRVLVVDDEPLIRRVVHMVLEPFHAVRDVGGGQAALAEIASQDFDVVVCDLMMPGMNGMELHAAVRELRPGLEQRLVFITGGAFVQRLAVFLESVENLRVAKPFDEELLLAAIAAAATR